VKDKTAGDCFGGTDAGFILRCSAALNAEQRERITATVAGWCSRTPRPPLVVGPEMTVHVLPSRRSAPDYYTV
jgi:hypothetical protein